MSITALIGVVIAIAILLIIVHVGLRIAARFGYGDGIVAPIVWAAAFILCLLLIASALGIPVPFFRW